MSSTEELAQERVAQQETGASRGRGRPPGSKTKSKVSSLPPPAPADPPVDPAVLEVLLDNSLGTLAELPCAAFQLRPLEPLDKQLVVQGCKPLIGKYLPGLMGEWAPEIFALCTLVLVYGPRFADKRAADSRRGNNGIGKNIPEQATGPELSPPVGDRPIM